MKRPVWMAAVAAGVVAFPFAAVAQTIAITGGTVYPVSGAPIKNGTVVITNGVITAVGAGIPVPAGAERLDATGKWVTPGFINSQTNLGVSEVSGVAETRDGTARGTNGVAAAFRVWDGLNPGTVLAAPARNEGITTVFVAPTGGMVAGQGALVDLVEEANPFAIRKAPAAMVGAIGNPRAAGAGARGELRAKWYGLLDDAKAYPLRKAKIEDGQSRTLGGAPEDLRALQPVLAGKVPLVIDADRQDDILAAIALGKDYKIKVMITGGAEAWMVADALAAAKVPVMTGGINNIPRSFSALGTLQENAALLVKAGVTVAMISDSYAMGMVANVRNVRYEAGNAVAAGLSWDAALRAVTLSPAEAWGVADQIGSLAAGKAGNVVVWSGDPFEFATQADAVIVRGKRVVSKTRQDELTDRYKQRPAKYRAP